MVRRSVGQACRTVTLWRARIPASGPIAPVAAWPTLGALSSWKKAARNPHGQRVCPVSPRARLRFSGSYSESLRVTAQQALSLPVTGPMTGPVTSATLAAFSAAWNRHDIDALMDFMSTDSIFQGPAAPDACGSRHVGAQAVRQAFAAVWHAVPDAQWVGGRHFVHGDFGVSQWTFTGTAADGSRIEADGIDVFTFRDGKIHLKNVFRKVRPNLPAPR